jgi:hypothetical protein
MFDEPSDGFGARQARFCTPVIHLREDSKRQPNSDSWSQSPRANAAWPTQLFLLTFVYENSCSLHAFRLQNSKDGSKEDRMTLNSLEVKSPQQIRAEKRRAEWEAERIAKVRQMVADGLLTEQEARERGA